jgi:hypothetical protein
MSKIALTPNATGTGVFTISSPATNTNRTLTLPDEAGTVLVNGTTSNVGIGTTTPARLLHLVKTDNSPQLRITGAADWDFYSYNDSSLYINNSTGTVLSLFANKNASFDGDLLVGTTVARTGTASITIEGDNSYQQFRAAGTGSLQQVSFYRNTAVTPTEVGYISTTGTATTYATSSDYRLKTDAQPMVGASARVLALKPVNFEWISDGSRVDGFLAHEAQAVVPECVTGTKDAMRDEEYEVTAAVYEDIIIAAVLDEEGNELEAERTEQRLVTEAVMGTRSVPDMQGIDQSKLVPLLTAALQEALNKIEAMETRLAALEAV